MMDKDPPAGLFRVEHRVTPADRRAMNGHGGGVLWLTGLSGSGKTTLALALEQHLSLKGYQAYVLDGDNIRGGLNSDLGFSPQDRDENIRRIGEVSALFAEAGFIAITAFISPYAKDRRRARAIDPARFREVHVNADLETCERRDPKGLYRKARQGRITDFTGISAPYEIPENPDLVIHTGNESVANSVSTLLGFVETEFGAAGSMDRVA
ncbi:MAG: adenylyl-sulfate kinase [Proteobacteria bacterium]|nr:adenylyl-sulfate kinase [Pseudomonadota bacterium]